MNNNNYNQEPRNNYNQGINNSYNQGANNGYNQVPSNNYNQMPNNNYNQGTYNGYNMPGSPNNMNKQKNGFGVASLVLGILSILGIIILIGPIILAPLSIIFGIIQLVKRRAKVMAVIGIILSVLSIITLVLMIIASANFIESGEATKILERAKLDIDRSDKLKHTFEDLAYGDWKYEEGAELSLKKGGKWTFYKDYSNKTDNYYEGSEIVIKQGQEAIEAFGGNEKLADNKDISLNINKLFYVELKIEKQVVNGRDKVAAGDYGKDTDKLVFKKIIIVDQNDSNSGIIVDVEDSSYDYFKITKQ